MPDLAGVWRYDTSTVIGSPGAGYLRTGTPPVSKAAVAATTFGGVDVHDELAALTTSSQIVAQEVNDATLAVTYMVTAPPVDHVTWVEFDVALVESAAVGLPRPNEQILLTGFAAPAHGPYASIDELQFLLTKPSPTADELAAMQRALEAAAAEIDWELEYTPDNPAPTPTPALVVQVNLERAVEHWNQWRWSFGVSPIGSIAEPIMLGANTWYRHHRKLAALKQRQGVA